MKNTLLVNEQKNDKNELKNIIIKTIKEAPDYNNKYDSIFGLTINNNVK